jgi:hypothetical protein
MSNEAQEPAAQHKEVLSALRKLERTAIGIFVLYLFSTYSVLAALVLAVIWLSYYALVTAAGNESTG